MKKWIRQPGNLFLVLGFVFGILYLTITPPFQVADENWHFYRAFQIAEGHLISQVHDDRAGGWLPENVIACGDSTLYVRWDTTQKISSKDIFDLFQLPLNPNERRFKPIIVYVYSPVAYVPSVFVIRIMIWLKSTPVLMMYIGRCANLLTWVGLIYLSIRILPFYKWVFFLLALTPTSLYQAASLSADCLTNGLAFLTIALFLRLIFAREGFLSKKVIVAIFLLTICLSLTKNIFFLISFLFLLTPVSRFSSKKKYMLFCFSLVGINMFVSFAWIYIVTRLPHLGMEKVNPDQQIHYIFSNAAEYVHVVVRTIVQNISRYFRSFIGAFGWQDVTLGKWHGRLWGGLLLAAALMEGNRKIIVSKYHKASFFILLTVICLSIFTLNYIHWNPVANDIIKDVQGRYFIPVAPLLLLCFYNRRLWRYPHGKPIVFGLMTLLSLANALYVFYLRFYGPS